MFSFTFTFVTDLGTKIKNEGRVAEGILHYKKALVYNSKYPDAWYNLGVAYVLFLCDCVNIDFSDHVQSELNETDEAVISYQVAIQLNPKCAEAYNNLGVIYKDRGNLERSITYYQVVILSRLL